MKARAFAGSEPKTSSSVIGLFTDLYSYYSVPSVDDDEWIAVTRPLLAFITKVGLITTNDVITWGKEHNHAGPKIRHMLAWLSFKDFVHHDYSSGVWRLGPPSPIAKPSTLLTIKSSGAETLIVSWKGIDERQPKQLEHLKRPRRKRA